MRHDVAGVENARVEFVALNGYGKLLSVTLMNSAQTTGSIVKRPSFNCSPAILVFPVPNMNPTAQGSLSLKTGEG